MKILVVDDEEDLRELITLTIESTFDVEVVQASSGNEAIRILMESPSFDCVVSDYTMENGSGEDLYRFLLTLKSQIPFILVTANNIESYPIFKEKPIAGYIQKPQIFKPLKKMLTDLSFGAVASTRAYCRIKTSLVLKFGLLAQDLYVKLSENKYVKVFRKGEVFDVADFERFRTKTIDYLYFRATDSAGLLEGLTSSLANAAATEAPGTDDLVLAGEAVEMISQATASMGFTKEVQALTRESVKLAVRKITADLQDTGLIDIELILREGYHQSHSVVLAHLACGIASMLGWTSGPTFLKLTTAAFLHDITLANEELARVRTFDDLAMQRNQFSEADVARYLSHPEDAAKLARELKDVPAEIDVLVIQHHERPDGSGFPNRLDHSKISPISSVFIVAHDLVHFYMENGSRAHLSRFINEMSDTYNRGNFKTVLKAITNSLVNSSAAA